MSNGGEWFKISRRDFAKAATVSIIAGAVTTTGKASAMSEQTDPATTQANDELIESRVRWLEDQLGRPILSNLRDKVAKQIAGNDSMSKRGRKFSVPDQTEPAFAFQPVAKR